RLRLGGREGRAGGQGAPGTARHPPQDEARALAPIYPVGVEDGLPDPAERFEEYAQDALESLPPALRSRISNVEIVVEEEPPPGSRLLGLYQGVPLTRRGIYYGGVLPDKITIYRGPPV